ncbi:MAG: TlpA disulfide reductase family protein [Bacteroidia bacterium]|nr:TlpA disulfide reductase family protein [Bacteroidia bacterium]
MKKIIFYSVSLNFILVCLLPKQALGQAKTYISGTIENAKNDSVNLTIDKTYLSQKQINYQIPLKQGQFNIEFQLDRNRLVEFTYQSQLMHLYLEPNDSLNIKFAAGDLPGSIVFSGKGAVNNQFNKNFNEQFKNDFTTSLIEDKMRSLNLDEFEMLIYDNRKKEKMFYTDHADKKLLSADFKKFIENQIKYNYLNYLLFYPVVNANKSTAILKVNSLPAVILEVLDKKAASDAEAMISESYRNFLSSFVTYYASELNGFNKFKDYTISTEKKYVIARDNLKGEPFLFYLTKYLLEMGEKTNPETVKRIYTEMEKEDKTGEYTAIVKEKLGKWMKTKLPKNAEGKLDIASADFKLQGFDGKEISLADFRGKVIYVDFWASWCGPCKQQFPFSKKLHEQLTDKQKKEVVFLYISIDNTEEIWKKAVNSLQLGGVHALSPGGWSSFVAKYYQINSIPRYLLIDKKGNVVDPNAKRPDDESTLQDILNLIE